MTAVGPPRGMDPMTKFGLLVNLLAFLFLVLDAGNFVMVCRSWSSSDGILVVSSIEPPSKEDCQIVPGPVLRGKPTFWANFLEYFRGNEHMIRSARRTLVEAGKLTEEDLARSELRHRVLFTPGGYEVEFTLLERRQDRVLAHGYGRTCPELAKFIHKEMFSGSCHELEETVERKINDLADDPERGRLFSHEARIDYQESTAFLMTTYCQSDDFLL